MLHMLAAVALKALGEFFLGEPENAGLVNDILVGTQPTTLTWLSDVAPPGGTSGPFSNPIPSQAAAVTGRVKRRRGRCPPFRG